MESTFAHFCKQYRKWLDDCLEEWNTQYDPRKFHQESVTGDYETFELVEFTEDGNAYPHGIGGTGHVPDAVTKWKNSEHFVI